MNKLLWITACLSISACTGMARFDAVQYNHWVELHTVIRGAEDIKACNVPSTMKRDIIPRMQARIDSIQTYIQYRPLPSGYGEVADIVRANVVELGAAYAASEPSVAYCNLKLSIINDSVKRMLAVEGRRLE